MAKPELTEWDEDLTASAEEEYDALVRAIRWAKGFGLLFVQCSPAQGEELIARVRDDVSDKTIDVLRLGGEVDDLYETVAALPDVDKTNVLFVTGLEKSLVPYIKPGYGSEGDYYAKDTVPKILGKLNLQREKFRETLKLCFVFLVPPYAMKYLIRRAADFFDWRSGVWEFVAPQAEMQKEIQRILQEGDYVEYLSWTPQKRRDRILGIEDLLVGVNHSADEICHLLLKQGNISAAEQQFDWAIASYDAALAIKPDFKEALHNKGSALRDLGYHEESIVNYDAALTIEPSDYHTLINKGNALFHLGRYEEAIASYNTALTIKPDHYEALTRKGAVLFNLGHYKEVIASCDAALAIKSDEYVALLLRGNALYALGCYEEGIGSYDAVLAIKSDLPEAFFSKGFALHALGRYEAAVDSYDAGLTLKADDYGALKSKGNALSNLGHYETAIASYDAALVFRSDDHEVLYRKGNAFADLGRYEDAIASYEAALVIKPDHYEALQNKGAALARLGQYKAAIASSDAALAIKPASHLAFYNKACCYSLQGQVEPALKALKQAIKLNPEKYIKMAKHDADFDTISDNSRFRALVMED